MDCTSPCADLDAVRRRLRQEEGHAGRAAEQHAGRDDHHPGRSEAHRRHRCGPVETPPELSIQELQRDLESRGLIGDVYFDYDRYELLPEARERLARNAEFINSSEGQGLTFTLEGHCDERGTNEYNIALGQRRATAALDYISSLGVDGGRFKTISFGEERPFCTESNEACWQKNRRARFVITGRS
jgi:peptidoglycan-associated lipoprotein